MKFKGINKIIYVLVFFVIFNFSFIAKADDNGSENNTSTNEENINNEQPQIKIELNLKNVTLTVGESVNLEVKLYPEDANKDVVWLSSDDNIVQVDNTGKVTAKNVGQAVIRAKIDENVFDECLVNVEPKKIDIDELEKRIVSSYTTGVITKTTNFYSGIGERYRGTLPKGTKVVILEERSLKWYYIKTPDGRLGWIKGIYLSINKSTTIKDRLTKEELEFYVNYKKLNSATNYLVWVDIARQRTYIFKKNSQNKFCLIQDFLVSTGRDVSPTKTGIFNMHGQRGSYMYLPQYKCSVKYWTRISGSYLFHSILYSRDGKKIIDPTLGVRSSHGCVRLKDEDSQWIYKNIPSKTTVWIN
ncbi:MAG: L,D-transpeptidase family protein [Caloramator sp.]|nr:L,D-transpeptidase family protein [Caloramator sp.]